MVSYEKLQANLDLSLARAHKRFDWATRDVCGGVLLCQDTLCPEEWAGAPQLEYKLFRSGGNIRTPYKNEKASYAYFLNRAEHFTVRQYLELLNAEARNDQCSNRTTQYRRLAQTKFGKTLLKMGVTAVEYVRMPKHSVTLERLKRLSRESLLALDSRVLPIISDASLSNFVDYSRIHSQKSSATERWPTIGELVCLSDEHQIYACGRSFSRETIAIAAAWFVELGFTAEDCVFIREVATGNYRESLQSRRRSLRRQERQLRSAEKTLADLL